MTEKIKNFFSMIDNPIRIIFEPTIECNLNCPMCDRTKKADFLEHKNNKLSDEKIESVINELCEMKIKNILLIGGGEPLMSRNILKHIELLSRRGVNVHLWTNGTLVNEHNAPILATYCKMITISFDSPHENVNDMSRGTNGAAKRSINAFRLLRKANSDLYLRAHSVISAINLGHLEEFIAFAKEFKINELGAGIMNDFSFVPESFVIDKEDQPLVVEKIDRVIQLAKEEDIALAGCYNPISSNAIEKIKEQFSEEPISPYCTCLGLWKQATIRPNGDVSVCCFTYKPILGNLHKNTFSEIWNSEEAKALREKVLKGEFLDSPCIGCDLGNPVFTKQVINGIGLQDFDNMLLESR